MKKIIVHRFISKAHLALLAFSLYTQASDYAPVANSIHIQQVKALKITCLTPEDKIAAESAMQEWLAYDANARAKRIRALAALKANEETPYKEFESQAPINVLSPFLSENPSVCKKYLRSCARMGCTSTYTAKACCCTCGALGLTNAWVSCPALGGTLFGLSSTTMSVAEGVCITTVASAILSLLTTLPCIANPCTQTCYATLSDRPALPFMMIEETEHDVSQNESA